MMGTHQSHQSEVNKRSYSIFHGRQILGPATRKAVKEWREGGQERESKSASMKAGKTRSCWCLRKMHLGLQRARSGAGVAKAMLVANHVPD